MALFGNHVTDFLETGLKWKPSGPEEQIRNEHLRLAYGCAAVGTHLLTRVHSA